MDRKGRWRLAPAYDVTFASNADNCWLAQHLTGVDGRFDTIAEADLLRLGDWFTVPNMKPALRDVRAAVPSWEVHARTVGLHGATTQAITVDYWREAI